MLERAILASLLFGEDQMVERIGREAYSYRFVYRAFAPLLARWGQTAEVTRPESRLDYAIWKAQQQKRGSSAPSRKAWKNAKRPSDYFPSSIRSTNPVSMSPARKCWLSMIRK